MKAKISNMTRTNGKGKVKVFIIEVGKWGMMVGVFCVDIDHAVKGGFNWSIGKLI